MTGTQPADVIVVARIVCCAAVAFVLLGIVSTAIHDEQRTHTRDTKESITPETVSSIECIHHTK